MSFRRTKSGPREHLAKFRDSSVLLGPSVVNCAIDSERERQEKGLEAGDSFLAETGVSSEFRKRDICEVNTIIKM